MRILFDTNIILDILLKREPFFKPAALLLSKVEKGEIVGVACATAFTTVYYLLRKQFNHQKAKEYINLLLRLLDVAAVNRIVIETAENLRNFKDFEDAVVYAAALHSNCNCIVTRNIKDFPESEIPVLLPEEVIKILTIKEEEEKDD